MKQTKQNTHTQRERVRERERERERITWVSFCIGQLLWGTGHEACPGVELIS